MVRISCQNYKSEELLLRDVGSKECILISIMQEAKKIGIGNSLRKLNDETRKYGKQILVF